MLACNIVVSVGGVDRKRRVEERFSFLGGLLTDYRIIARNNSLFSIQNTANSTFP